MTPEKLAAAGLVERVARAICSEDARINGRRPCGSSRKHACRVCALLATAAIDAMQDAP